MKIVIPMAGFGQRFVDNGYTDPKPMIKVGGKRIIEYIIDMFDSSDEFVFICNENHIKNHKIDLYLKNLLPNCVVLSMPEHKKGPCFTTQVAYDYIKDDEEVIVSYCDNPYIYDYKEFKQYVKSNNLDGCILSHTGFHPHTLAETKMAFMLEENGIVKHIQEKKCYTDNPENEHASTGTYYFKKGEYVKKYFDLLIERDINYNNEYYVTLVYNLLIEDSLKVGYFDTPQVMVFGTPEEVKQFEAWKTIVSGKQIKTIDNLIKTYNYWKKYHGTV
jgi:NDP-sugar pyrophosphorylase family protein